ncbi:hypothetical protein AgCh_034560 [Apium graveolens]
MKNFFTDLRDILKKAYDRHINEFMKRAKAAKIHSYIISHLKKNVHTTMGKAKAHQMLIDNFEDEFKKMKTSSKRRRRELAAARPSALVPPPVSIEPPVQIPPEQILPPPVQTPAQVDLFDPLRLPEPVDYMQFFEPLLHYHYRHSINIHRRLSQSFSLL